MKIIRLILLAAALSVLAAWGLSRVPAVALAQSFGFMSLSGGSGSTGAFGRPVSIPAYLLSKNISTATTTYIKGGPGVVGCFVVNKAGAGSTAIIYNAYTAQAGYILATIDTSALNEFCYGMIFSGALTVVTSGGTAADITITYR